MSAINTTIAPQIGAFAETQRHFAHRAVIGFPKIYLQWLEGLDRLIPSNLRGLLQELDVVASVALDEGIPLCWIPRGEIVVALITAGNPQERQRILSERQEDILDDCEVALATSTQEWAVECRSAIDALRQGNFGPAQSHASNIVDSIVRAFTGRRPRDFVVGPAPRNMDEIPLRQVAFCLARCPLDRVFTSWWPNSGNPPPAHFARHPTAHAVGSPGVFDPVYALVAVMLATSLTLQLAVDPPGIGAR